MRIVVCIVGAHSKTTQNVRLSEAVLLSFLVLLLLCCLKQRMTKGVHTRNPVAIARRNLKRDFLALPHPTLCGLLAELVTTFSPSSIRAVEEYVEATVAPDLARKQGLFAALRDEERAAVVNRSRTFFQ